MARSVVIVRFPKTGLGNMMLTWARAQTFAYLNNIPIVTGSWWGVRAGSWLRRERKKRLYWGYFREDSVLSKIWAKMANTLKKVVAEPEVKKIEEKGRRNCVYLFNEVSPGEDLFGPFREHRGFIKEKLFQQLTERLQTKALALPPPEISIHVRRGDFKLANPITSNEYFIQCINLIRDAVGYEMAVTVFSDAEKHEIDEILSLPNVQFSDPQEDILDILQMSKSKVIVTSRSSTFSYWAVFLSDAIVLKPYSDWQGDLRPASANAEKPEFKIDFRNEDEVSFIKEEISNLFSIKVV